MMMVIGGANQTCLKRRKWRGSGLVRGKSSFKRGSGNLLSNPRLVLLGFPLRVPAESPLTSFKTRLVTTVELLVTSNKGALSFSRVCLVPLLLEVASPSDLQATGPGLSSSV